MVVFATWIQTAFQSFLLESVQVGCLGQSRLASLFFSGAFTFALFALLTSLFGSELLDLSFLESSPFGRQGRFLACFSFRGEFSLLSGRVGSRSLLQRSPVLTET